MSPSHFLPNRCLPLPSPAESNLSWLAPLRESARPAGGRFEAFYEKQTRHLPEGWNPDIEAKESTQNQKMNWRRLAHGTLVAVNPSLLQEVSLSVGQWFPLDFPKVKV